MGARFEYLKEQFERECDSCASLFKVEVLGQKGHEEREEYYCPVCGKEYSTRASKSPNVTLIRRGRE